jgi:energy-coupling factor transport system ATP-binding protein
LIKLENVTFYYNETNKPALRDVSLKIEGGELVLVTGSSGGGKSTLCRLLNGLIPHFYGGKLAGRVEINGLDVTKHSTKEMATTVGMIFQDPENQLVATDVEREIAFGLENLAFPRDLIARRIEESLDTLGISALRYRQTHELSGGEKQKVAIASVLALHPDILVLDEPTSELDPKGAEDVLSMVKRLNDELGITVILIEHRLDRVAHLADRVVILHEGKVIADGKPREIMSDKETDNIGLGIPPIADLTRRLKDRGAKIEGIPLTVKEGRLMLGEVFRDAKNNHLCREDKKFDGLPVIEIKNLSYTYPDGPPALKNVSLSICEGEFIAIMGRNASGKTTLAKHLNGLLKPTKGSVRITGIDTTSTTTAELARVVGYLFQNPNDHLFADTVEEEIVFTLKNMGLGKQELASRTSEILKRFELNGYREQYPRSLSGGERQRVALASVLAASPGILILDEPTRGMDHGLKRELMEFLNDYRSKGNTVVLITHDVEMVSEYTDRVILMSEGRMVVEGGKHKVLSKALLFSPQINRLAQAFVGEGVPDGILTVDEALDVLT